MRAVADKLPTFGLILMAYFAFLHEETAIAFENTSSHVRTRIHQSVFSPAVSNNVSLAKIRPTSLG
jgi:hypothetical protein